MAKIITGGCYHKNNALLRKNRAFIMGDMKEKSLTGSMSYQIFKFHNSSTGENLKLRADAIVIENDQATAVLQLLQNNTINNFNLPVLLSNANITCLDVQNYIESVAKKYGAICLPQSFATTRQYLLESMAKTADVILSTSNRQLGSLGCMSINVHNFTIVNHLKNQTIDIDKVPQKVAIYLRGKARKGIGGTDIALDILKVTLKNNFLKDKIVEIFGTGVKHLSQECRNTIDSYMHLTGCFATIWQTDEKTKAYLSIHGRESDYKELKPDEVVYYDFGINVNLNTVVPMIALPFVQEIYKLQDIISPSIELIQKFEKLAEENPNLNTFVASLKQGNLQFKKAHLLNTNYEILANIASATYRKVIDKNNATIYLSSQAIYRAGLEANYIISMMDSGFDVKVVDKPTSIYAPPYTFTVCSGEFFQADNVMILDAYTITASLLANGHLVADKRNLYNKKLKKYKYFAKLLDTRISNYENVADHTYTTKITRHIQDLPSVLPVKKHMLLKVAATQHSGKISANDMLAKDLADKAIFKPTYLAKQFLKWKDKEYYQNCQNCLHEMEAWNTELNINKKITNCIPLEVLKEGLSFGTCIVANSIGDDSMREEIAFTQRTNGGLANIAHSYSQNYRQALIQWGIIPFTYSKGSLKVGDYIFIENIIQWLNSRAKKIQVTVMRGSKKHIIDLVLDGITEEERKILLNGKK